MTNFDFQPKSQSNLLGNILLSLCLIALVAIAAGLWRGDGGDTPEPPQPLPVITEDVAAVAAEAEVARLQMEAQASEEIAKKLKAGEIKTSNQLYQWATAYQDKIDQEAYREINKLNQKYLVEADKGYTAEQLELIAEFQSLKAKGKRKVAQ